MVSVLDAPTGDSDETRIPLMKILQVEFSPHLLPDREAILRALGTKLFPPSVLMPER